MRIIEPSDDWRLAGLDDWYGDDEPLIDEERQLEREALEDRRE
ncbi:hypothetical protein [Burkholderia multivorans]|nr:hypothetical protein [Burkholderia multivorans]